MNKKELIKTSVDDILGYMGIKPEVEIDEQEGNAFNVSIKGDNLSFLIGYRGQSLDALQHLVGLFLFKKTQEWTTIVVDINGYKDSKVERIQEIAKKFIDRVRFFQSDVELPAMNPWERRQVHMLVSEYDDVISESTGSGLDRHIVLKPKRK